MNHIILKVWISIIFYTKYIGIVLFILFISLKCRNKDQDITYIGLSDEDIRITEAPPVDSSVMAAAYPLVRSLPLNYDTTTTEDYTDIIQKVLEEHNNVIFPGFPLFVNASGLSIRSNSRLIFEKGSQLVFQANNKERYEVLRIHEVEDVELYSPCIIGDREKHLGSEGEWGFGISVRGSQRVKIENAEIRNCWGDGIYLGSTDSIVNTDIVIEDCFIDNNRRNGISIISGINIDIVNCLISNTNGTAPEGGIDIEPNNNLEFLENINIIKTTTYNNGGIGLSMVFIHFQGQNNKNVKINVKNHVDVGSLYSMGFALGDLNNNLAKIEGDINVVNSVWKNNKRGLVALPDFNNNRVSLNFIMAKAFHNDSNIARKAIEELKRICEEEKTFSFSE